MATAEAAIQPTAEELILARPVRSLWSDAWVRLKRNKLAIVGALVIILFTIIALLAPVIAPHSPLKIYPGKAKLPPAWVEKAITGKAGDPNFLLGTDSIGRDMLSRVIYGAPRCSLA